MNALATIVLAVITTPEAPRFLPMTEAWQTNRPIPAAFVASGTFVRGSRVESEITRETVTNAAAVLSIFDGYWERDQIARCSLTNFVTHGTGTTAVVTNLWHFQEPLWKEVDYRATVTNVGWVDSSSYPTNRETSPTVRMVEAHRLAQVNDHLGVVHSLSGEDFLTETFGRESFFSGEPEYNTLWPDYSWASRYPEYEPGDWQKFDSWLWVLPTFSAVESRDPAQFLLRDDCPARRFWTPAWERVLLYYSNGGGHGWQGVDFGMFVHGPSAWSGATRFGLQGWLAGSRAGLEYRYAIPRSGALCGIERALKYNVGEEDATNQYRVATQMLNRVYLRHDRNYLGAMNQLLADCEWDLRTPIPDTLPTVASNVIVYGHAYGHFDTGYYPGTYSMWLNSTNGIEIYNKSFYATGDHGGTHEAISEATPKVRRAEPRYRIEPSYYAPTNTFSITAQGQFDCTVRDIFDNIQPFYAREGDGFDFDLLFVNDSGSIVPWSICRLMLSTWYYVYDGVTNYWNADKRPLEYEDAWMVGKESALCMDGSITFNGELGAMATGEWTLPSDRAPVECTNEAARALWDCGALTNIEISTAEGRIASTNVWERGGHYMFFDPADSIEAEPHFRCRSGYGKFNATSPYDHAATRRRLLDDANKECALSAHEALSKIVYGLGDADGNPIDWLLPPLRAEIAMEALYDLPNQASSEIWRFCEQIRNEDGAHPARLMPVDPHYRGFAEFGLYSDGSIGIKRIYKINDQGVRTPIRWTDGSFESVIGEGDVGLKPLIHTLTVSSSIGGYPWYLYKERPIVNFTRPVGADVHQGLVERRFWSWHNLRRQ